MKKEIILKYLNNTCNETELSEVFFWLKTNYSEDLMKDVGRSEWLSVSENYADFGFEKFHRLLDKIHHRINIRKNLFKATYNNFNKYLIIISNKHLWIKTKQVNENYSNFLRENFKKSLQ